MTQRPHATHTQQDEHFIALAALAANVIRYLTSHAKQNENADTDTGGCETGQQRPNSEGEDINHEPLGFNKKTGDV